MLGLRVDLGGGVTMSLVGHCRIMTANSERVWQGLCGQVVHEDKKRTGWGGGKGSEYLVKLFAGLARVAGAGVPVLCPTSTVSPTAQCQEAAWEKDGVGGLQLLPQVHREVSRGAAVALHILIQPVQVN